MPAIDSVKVETTISTGVRRSQLVGKWLGESDTKDGKHEKWLMERRADGTFTVKFQQFFGKQKVLEQVEAGFWGTVADSYFSLTREILVKGTFRQADVTKDVYYDSYRILRFDGTVFEYKALDSDNTYSVRRVENHFQL